MSGLTVLELLDKNIEILMTGKKNGSVLIVDDDRDVLKAAAMLLN